MEQHSVTGPGRMLEGKVALVTGASSGIGEAIARRFSGEGAAVHLTGTNTERLTSVTQGLPPDRTMWSAMDLANSHEVADLVRRTVDRFSGLDILVNCGAVVDRRLRVKADETTLELWDRVMAVNVTAPFVLSVAALAPFRAAERGSIVNIASIGGIGAFPRFCPYVVSKGALISLTKSMALDYGLEGIRVNAIAPGAIDTPQVADEPDRPAYLRMIGERTAVGRIGEAREIASVATFLASDESSYVTGEVIVVDGGRTVRA